MSLYLVETTLDENYTQETIHDFIDQLQTDEVQVIETQIAKNFRKAYFIFEADNVTATHRALENSGLKAELVKEVRLVGKDLDEIKKENEKVNYLVEWELPENLTMDQYLERKKKNSVHYEEVPEVTFSRTYVCEDMTKCLCFYDAPDEKAVQRAREAVKAPITSMTQLENE